MVEAEVQFDYTAQEPDELTLHKGDVITEITVQPGGWWEGKLNGKRGMFPDNFVKVIGGDSSGDTCTGVTVTRRKSGGRKCKVLYSYQPANDDELKLQVNDIIEILDEVEEGWWKGKLRNQTGVFPSNFVAEITDDHPVPEPTSVQPTAQKKSPKPDADEPSKPENTVSHDDIVHCPCLSSATADSDVPVLPPKPVKEVCKVLYPYKAVNDDELTLKEGDLITLISRDGQDKGWWKGELHGQIGVFPDNFVQVLPVDETSKPLRPPSKVTSATTTNRTRDSITKPTLIVDNLGGSPPTLSNSNTSISQKKVLETPPKTDEKTSPPGISRKPTLPPPPLKKPQRSPSGSTSKQSISSSLSVSEVPSVKPESPSPGSSSRSPGISAILAAAAKQGGGLQETSPSHPGKISPGIRKAESSDSTDGAGLSVLTGSNSFNLNHHNHHHPHHHHHHHHQSHNENARYNSDADKSEIDLDCVGRTAMLTHPTASRVRAPRRRPPSSISTKDDMSGVVTNSVGMMNGNVDTHVDNKVQGTNKAWIEELKMTHAKKPFSQGRTRVMIGPGSVSSGAGEMPSTSPEAPATSPTVKPTGVIFRNNNSPIAPRPQSMYSGDKISPNPRPFSVIGTSSDSITLSVKQWTELNDKVSRLEATIGSQQEIFTEAIKELTNKLNEETERVLQMQLEIEKLTDLVTQV